MGIWFFLNGKLCASVRQHGLRRIPKKLISCACGGIGNVHFVHSTQLRCVAVRFAMRIACGSSGKKATFTSFTPAAKPLLSHLSSRSPYGSLDKSAATQRVRQHGLRRISKKVITYAPVVELADTLDLGSSARAWGFKSLQAHQRKRPQGLFYL